MVTVKFVNRSAERVLIYQEDGSVLKIMESAKCFDRDPAGGELRTVVLHQNEEPVPPQSKPKWIKETEWVYEECSEHSNYAPFKMIIFEAGNEVKLKRRHFWKFPEMDWPVVTFLFESNRMKLIKDRLEGEYSGEASIFLNGIPVRKTVSPLSKYAQYQKWFFCEQPMKNANPKQIGNREIIQFGESLRSKNELEKIEVLRAKAKEREKAKLV